MKKGPRITSYTVQATSNTGEKNNVVLNYGSGSWGNNLEIRLSFEDIQEAIDVLTEIKNDEIEKLIQRVKEK